jgi:DNA-directed RNA polymerase specialized sigma24 family protein
MEAGEMQEEAYTREFIRAWLRDWARLERKSESDLEWAELKADIWGAVMQLADDQQIAFELYFCCDYTPSEIKLITDWSFGTILNAIHSGEKEIFRILTRDAEHPQSDLKGAYPTGWVGGRVEWYDRS